MAATGDDSELTKLQVALASLRDSAEIMDRFSHRNKNQHRRSAWWAELSILRRGVRKLLSEGEAREKTLQVPASRQRTKKSKRTQVQERQLMNHDGQFHTRAQWTQQQAVPRAYLAFTQLAADNQYAALGVLLLGVLAQVSAALSPYVGEEEPGSDVDGAAPLRGEKAAERLPEARNAVENFGEGELAASSDLGIAIRREDARSAVGIGVQESLGRGEAGYDASVDFSPGGIARSGLVGQGADVKVARTQGPSETAKAKTKKKEEKKTRR